MNTRNWVLAGALAFGAVGIFSGPTFAHKAFLDKARRLYQLDVKNGKCDLCHEIKPKEEPGAKNLNMYGKAIAADPDMKPLLGRVGKKVGDKVEDVAFTEAEIKIVEKVMTKLENADSDGDGVTNKEELALGSNPGDPKSKPEKRALDKYRKDNGTPATAPKPK